MKKVVVFTGLILFCITGTAQTVALDFNRTDGSGVSHHLYSELDSGNVMILEYIMLNCSPCLTAAKELKTVVYRFSSHQPGKVKQYAIGFADSYTSDQMNAWKASGKLDAVTTFTGGATEVEYYGGMGMPTVLVVGGPQHKVFYKRQGFSKTDTSDIRQAIENALLAGGTTIAGQGLQPRVADGKELLALELNKQFNLVEVSTATGKSVHNQNVHNSQQVVLNTTAWPAGDYLITLMDTEGAVITRRLTLTR